MKKKDLIMKSVTELLDLEEDFPKDVEQYIEELTDDMEWISEEIEVITKKIWWIETNLSTIVESNKKENQSVKEMIGKIREKIKEMSWYLSRSKKETNEFIKQLILEKKESILSDVKKLHEALKKEVTKESMDYTNAVWKEIVDEFIKKIEELEKKISTAKTKTISTVWGSPGEKGDPWITDPIILLSRQNFTVDTYSGSNQILEWHREDGTTILNTYSSNLLQTAVYTLPDTTVVTLTVSYDGNDRVISALYS